MSAKHQAGRTATRTSQRAARSARELAVAQTPLPQPALLRAAGDLDNGPSAAVTKMITYAAPRGQHTPAYDEWAAAPSPTKPTHTLVLTNASKQKATRSDGVREPHRGELEGISAKYKGISDLAEFKKLCGQLDRGELKWTEHTELYARGKISTSKTTIIRYVKGEPDPKYKTRWLVKPGAYKTMEAPPGLSDAKLLLGLEAEELMVHIAVRCFRRKKGLTERDIKMWARAQVLVL